VLIIPG